MNQKRSPNSKISSWQRENDTVAEEKNQVELDELHSGDRVREGDLVREQSSNPHQINSFHQFLWFWRRHSSWSYFNHGLFWGGLVSLTSILSAIGGATLTKIDLVEQQVSQRLQGNASALTSVEEQTLIKELKPNPLRVNLLPEYTPSTIKNNQQLATSTIARPKPLSSDQTSVLARQHPVQDKLVAVQNTTNNPELGRQVVAYLRQQNFRHVYLVKHIPLKLKQTNIVSNYGQVETANYLKNILGFGNLEAKSTLQQPKLVLQLGEDALFSNNYRFDR
jgi:LytR cell envelope-related transcriptional attenuator